MKGHFSQHLKGCGLIDFACNNWVKKLVIIFTQSSELQFIVLLRDIRMSYT